MVADKAQAVETRILALAEQVGRLIGTVESKAEGWFDQKALNRQVEQIRDSASELLEHLGGAIESGRAATRPAATKPAATPGTPPPAGRSGGTVDAPRKAHRPRAKSVRGARHSDETVAKIKGAKTMRRGNRRG
jgi:hypothetical protein